MKAILQDIIRYPIKGFSGQTLEFTHLQAGEGLPFDRYLAITNGQREVAVDGGWTPCQAFVRLTKNAILPRFAIACDDVLGSVSLRHPDGQCINVLIGNTASVEAANRMIASWFPAGQQHLERVAEARPGLGYWDHDDAALSIINLDSIAHLSQLAGTTIDPRRFRSNFHIQGCGAWSEFALIGKRLRIGDAEVEILRPIDRCSAPSVNPDSGDIDLNIPAILARHAGHIYCGVYARVIKGGLIKPQDDIAEIGRTQEVVKAASQRPTAPPVVQWPRSAEVVDTHCESESVRSFWFRDSLEDDAMAPPLVPGQHIRLHAVGSNGSYWRSYTVSGKRADGQFRISVKRDPKGACSGWFHDQLTPGSSVVISGPFGSFVQPNVVTRPVSMLSAGIGITPLLAMLQGLADSAPATVVRFTHVCRNASELALWAEVEAFKAGMPNLSVLLYLNQKGSTGPFPSGALSGAIQWRDEVAWASANKAVAYLCGPKGFMRAARDQLKNAGIADEDIRQEVFASPATFLRPLRAPPESGPFMVHFTRSGVTAEWTTAVGSLLDLAEAAGLSLPANCRGGACGTCAQTVQSGNVAYVLEPVIGTDARMQLLCCAVPTSTLRIDS